MVAISKPGSRWALHVMMVLSFTFFNPSYTCDAIVDVSTCTSEPWGRYSVVGDWNTDGTAFYSFSGDTSSASDGLGGVVRTNFKYNITSNCWSQLPSPDVAVGYRATAVRVQEDGIVVVGGADNVYDAVDYFYKFNEETEQLEDISAQYPDRPSARYKHAAIAILDGSTMLVTGGRQGDTVLSDVWMFSLASGWEKMSDIGFAGESLYRHSMAWDPDTQSVWAYGGLDGDFQRNGELWRADANDLASGFLKVNTNSWQIDPPNSASHGMVYFGGKIYVWGGTCGDDSTLFMYDVTRNTWCKVRIEDDLDGYSKPSRRDAFIWLPRFNNQGESSSHSFLATEQTGTKLDIFVAGGDVICVYGGQRAYTIMDVWRLSIEENSTGWTLLYRPHTARNKDHGSDICSNSQRTSCRAAVSIEEDIATTSRPSEEDTSKGQECTTSIVNIITPSGNNTGGLNATGNNGSPNGEMSTAATHTFRATGFAAALVFIAVIGFV